MLYIEAAKRFFELKGYEVKEAELLGDPWLAVTDGEEIRIVKVYGAEAGERGFTDERPSRLEFTNAFIALSCSFDKVCYSVHADTIDVIHRADGNCFIQHHRNCIEEVR